MHLKTYTIVFVIFVLPFFVLADGDDGDHAHEEEGGHIHVEGEVTEGLAVNLNIVSSPVITGTTTTLNFFVNKMPGNNPVSLDTLSEVNGNRLHVYGVSADFKDFFHLTPLQKEAGNFSAEHIFETSGIYQLLSSVVVDAEEHVFAQRPFEVVGDTPQGGKDLNFGRNAIVGSNEIGNYQVALDAGDPFPAGRSHDVFFTVKTATGNGVVLDPVLGEIMHLTAVKEDFSVFIHEHPNEDGDHVSYKFINEALAHGIDEDDHEIDPTATDFHITLPDLGFYKLFVEFRPIDVNLQQGKVLVASFWVQAVEVSVVSARAQWWVLLIISLILMSILSFGVHRYINRE